MIENSPIKTDFITAFKRVFISLKLIILEEKYGAKGWIG